MTKDLIMFDIIMIIIRQDTHKLSNTYFDNRGNANLDKQDIDIGLHPNS